MAGGDVGLEPGDLVALQLPPGPRWPGLLEEIWSAGAALLPVDHRLPAPAVEALLRRARPGVIVDAAGRRRDTDGVPVDAGVGAVVATSGSTGEPRLVMLGRAALSAAVTASAERLGIGVDDPWLLCIPPSHIGGLLVLLRGLVLGCEVVTGEASVVSQPWVRCVSVVPTLLHRLLESGADLAHLRAILVGGDRLPASLHERAIAAGLPVVHTYGQTESCGGVVYDGIPLSGVVVRCGENSEVEIGGPTLMRGCRFDAEETTARLREDGWLRTGDAGRIDAQGGLCVDGRLDDVIISGGEKVWPGVVEDVLRTHPAVAEAVVVGRPDSEWGQRVVAVVVPRGDGPTLEDLRRLVSAQLPAWAAPRELELRSALPAVPSGKMARLR